MLVAEVADWPVVAAGYGGAGEVVVVSANRVVAASAAARAGGVREGMVRREAQRLCPDVVVVAADPGRDARAWEPVVAAVETFTTGVEVARPGVVALAARGPSRYFGGDGALGQRVAAAVAAAAGQPCLVGVADGRLAATLAARSAPAGDAVRVVSAGASAAFLAPWPVAVLERPELADLLVRLGLATLGHLASLPRTAVLARFGPDGIAAHRLARGLDERPLAARTPPPDLAVAAEMDPPADRVDTAAFVGKSLADELHGRLGELGLACTVVAIEAHTDHGETLTRRWRHEGALSAGAVADRVRWQLDGWITSGQTTAGINRLRLVPEEVRPDNGRQLGLWGGSAAAGERVGRSLARIQGLLGPEAVVTAVIGGGRDPASQVRLVPWGDPRGDAKTSPGPRRHRRRAEVAPWPGRLPGPAPAAVYPVPVPAQVLDAAGRAVTVTARGLVSAAPATFSVAGGPGVAVQGWAGPWPAEERWWDGGGRRRARFQLGVAGGAVHLVSRQGGRWWLEATYD